MARYDVIAQVQLLMERN